MKKTVTDPTEYDHDQAVAEMLEMEQRARKSSATELPEPKFKVGQIVDFTSSDLFGDAKTVQNGQIVQIIEGDYVLALPNCQTATVKEHQIFI